MAREADGRDSRTGSSSREGGKVEYEQEANHNTIIAIAALLLRGCNG